MNIIILVVSCIVLVKGRTASDSLKGQFCTDPRTMKKHQAYTEWADAYSCTRHRCQPGGRTLAIYTVGCKRVEAPESAIECEEVVEDTNMQFPYCCTRLRCLVVVRGEVWTRVLGQPWETLPAAPWSHMYKMKKPPPVAGTFLPKEADAVGPVYELTEPEAPARDKVRLRSENTKKDAKDCQQPVPRSAAQTPDIVIALSTGNDKKSSASRTLTTPGRLSVGRGIDQHNVNVKRDMALESSNPAIEDDRRNEIEAEEAPIATEKIPEAASYESYNNFYSLAKASKTPQKRTQEKDEYDYNTYTTTKAPKSRKNPTTADWNQEHWNEHDSEPKPANGNQIQWAEPHPETEPPPPLNEPQSAASAEKKEKEEKPANLQALVDAIGTRMRDIEHVVEKMTSNVHPNNEPPSSSSELRAPVETGVEVSGPKPKQANTDASHYKRFNERRNNQYLHGTEYTTEVPLFVEDSNLNGYYSDASNSLLRRANGPKEPHATYMAPVNTEGRRGAQVPVPSSQEEPKRKKHAHKKKKSHRGHKKHHKEEKKKYNKISSTEVDKNANVVSLEDSSIQ